MMIQIKKSQPIEKSNLGGTEYAAESGLTAPILGATLRLDEISTDLKPVFTWVNSEGGIPSRRYVLHVDISPFFDTQNLIEMSGIPEGIHVTVARIEKPLEDNTQWFWRVKAVDSAGIESPWSTELGGVTARIFINTTMNKKFEYMRVSVQDVEVSSGQGKELILDYDSENKTYWEGAADESSHWVQFDLGEPKPISRIFQASGYAYTMDILPKSSTGWSDISNLDGRLAAFVWQYSNDGTVWTDIAETERKNSDSFREIIDFEKPITSRYIRVFIKAWHGRSPRIYDVMLYTCEQPPVPEVPKGNYVLVIRNTTGFKPELGIVKTDFGKMVRGQEGNVAPPWDLKVLELPAHAFSVEVLNQMNPKPLAIFLSGSPSYYCQLPMFEFNGEYELIRTTDIPTWGVCAGLQLMVMAYGSTSVTSAGRSYTTNQVKDIVDYDIPPIDIQKDDPIFAGMNNPFYGSEFHSLMVRAVPEGWDLLATSRDSEGITCIEMIKAMGRTVYGTQFHPEIAKPFNCAKGLLMSFLTMAVERAKKEGTWINQ